MNRAENLSAAVDDKEEKLHVMNDDGEVKKEKESLKK